jgi:hypothetical protein
MSTGIRCQLNSAEDLLNRLAAGVTTDLNGDPITGVAMLDPTEDEHHTLRTTSGLSKPTAEALAAMRTSSMAEVR